MNSTKNKKPVAYIIECDNIGIGSVGNGTKRQEIWWAKDMECVYHHPTLYKIISELVEK